MSVLHKSYCILVSGMALLLAHKVEASAIIPRLSADVQPTHYQLKLTIDPNAEQFSGETNISVSIKKPTKIIILHAQDLKVQKATIYIGKTAIPAVLKQTDKNGTAELSVASDLPTGDANIDILYSAAYSTTLDGLYKVKDGGKSYIFHQFEAIAARKAFPCFDEPGFKTPYDIQVTLPAKLKAVSNTLETATETIAGGMKRLTFETTKPLPTYLVAFAVGDLDIVTWKPVPANSVRLKPLPLRGVATHGKGAQLSYALGNTAPLLSALESYFGISYPYQKLDILAVPDFAAGAMENAGAITYREELLLLGKNSSLEELRNYGSTHAHEMSHQWFGDLVTPYWWDNIWLNESFASWAEFKVAQSWKPKWQFDLDTQRGAYGAMRIDARTNTRAIQQAIVTEDDISNAFDGITYEKGAGVLAMVENYMGEAAFQQGVRLHMQRYRFGNAKAEDFYQSLADGGKQPEIIPTLKSFVQQPGLPQVSVDWTCATGKAATLHLSQSRYLPYGATPPAPLLWSIPVTMVLYNGTAHEKFSTMLGTASADVAAPGTSCPTAILPDSGGHGYYRWSVPAERWTTLIGKLNDMPVTEALSAASNINAAFTAGAIDAATYLNLVPTIAHYPSHLVSTVPMGRLAWMAEHMPDAASRQKTMAFMKKIYMPMYTKLGLEPTTALDKSNPPEAELLRAELVNFLAEDAEDSKLRAELAKRGRAYMGFGTDGKIHPSAISPALSDVAVKIAAQDGDAGFTQYLISHLAKQRDANVRGRIINALATVTSPSAFKLVQPLAASKNIKGNEAEHLVFRRAADKKTRESAWAWFKNEPDAIITRTADDRRDAFPFLASGFCSAADRADVAKFFTPELLSKARGSTRSLAQSLEEIEQCDALRTKQLPAARAYLAAQ